MDVRVAKHLNTLGWHKIKPEAAAPADFADRVEAEIGRALPPSYREFLTAWPCRSGPRTVVCSPILGGRAGRKTHRFMECSGFDPKARTLMNMDGDYPRAATDGMLLVADDILSNWFFLNLEKGSVWYLNRSGKGAKERANLVLVGEDFADFLSRLEPE